MMKSTFCCYVLFYFVLQVKKVVCRIQAAPFAIPHNSRHLKDNGLKSNILLRGGFVSGFNLKDAMLMRGTNASLVGSTTVLVSTVFGSLFLDKTKRLTLDKNSSVFDLKHQISAKFPGSPPKELQRLYYNSRILNDNEKIGSLTLLSPVPILLDMMSGTSIYDKSLSVTQGLDAYVATITQQAFLGSEMQALLHTADTNATWSTEMKTLQFRLLYQTINASIYENYWDDIQLALEAEKDPEIVTADTTPWRAATSFTNPLTTAIAKEFDLNWKGFTSYLQISLVLLVSSIVVYIYYH